MVEDDGPPLLAFRIPARYDQLGKMRAQVRA